MKDKQDKKNHRAAFLARVDAMDYKYDAEYLELIDVFNEFENKTASPLDVSEPNNGSLYPVKIKSVSAESGGEIKYLKSQ